MAVRDIWNRAEVFLRAGQFDEAVALYEQLAQEASAVGYASLRLGELALGSGRLRAATRYVLRAYGAAQPEPSLLLQLCRQLLVVGEARAALAVAHALLQSGNATAAVLADLAKQMSDAMEPELALAALARAQQRGLPVNAGVAYLKGLNQLYMGELAAAEASLRTSVELDPGFVPAYWSLAKLRRVDGRAGRIDALRALAKQSDARRPGRSLLLYSLFQELDAADDVEAAWPVLVEAMQVRRAEVQYDEPSERALLGHAGEQGRLLAEARETPVMDASTDADPIMVVGMPRTGTTVIETALANRYRLRGIGERHEFVQQLRWVADLLGGIHPDRQLLDAVGAQQLAEAGSRYLERTRWRAGSARHFSDKWPENYKIISHALAAIPKLRVLAVERDGADACWSNLKEWFGNSYQYSYDIGQTARRHVDYSNLIETVRTSFGDRVVTVGYEAFVRAPDEETARIAKALQLQPAVPHSVAASVIPTASAVQVRGEITTRNVGAWKRYERWLSPLQKELEQARSVSRG